MGGWGGRRGFTHVEDADTTWGRGRSKRAGMDLFLAGGGIVKKQASPFRSPPKPHMMPQVDSGLATWQVQADWQYCRTVW